MLVGLLVKGRSIEQVLTIIPLSLIFLAPVYYKFWYYPTLSYYTRFVSLLTKQITAEGYLLAFDKNLAETYEVARLVLGITKPGDKIFASGNSAIIYSLPRRLPTIIYTADYHIKDYSTIKVEEEKIIAARPKVIVLAPDGLNYPQLQVFIEREYLLLDTPKIVNFQVWRRLNEN